MDALLVVDIQNDFLPGGALGVPDGDKVVPVVNRVRFFADCAAKKGLLWEQQKSGLKDIGSVLPLTPEKCG
jgi:hypothetical protein